MAKNDNWTTPQALFDWLNKRFKFNVDAAASAKNTKCKIYYSKQNSFLKPDIHDLGNELVEKKARIFVNPPYSLDQEFATRLMQLWLFHRIPSYILLPQRCDRVWFQQMMHNPNVRDEPFTGRIHFGNAKGGAFMYNVGVVLGFKEVKTFDFVDAGQFNKDGKGSATT